MRIRELLALSSKGSMILGIEKNCPEAWREAARAGMWISYELWVRVRTGLGVVKTPLILPAILKAEF